MKKYTLLIIIIVSYYISNAQIESQIDNTLGRHLFDVSSGVDLLLSEELKEDTTLNQTNFFFAIDYNYFFKKYDNKLGLGIDILGNLPSNTYSSASLIFRYRPVRTFIISAGGSFLYNFNNNKSDIGFIADMYYDFDIANVYLGPFVRFSFAKDIKYIYLGLRFGISAGQ